MPAGRPTEYSDETLTVARAYLDSCKDVEVQQITGESDKFTSYKNKLRVNIPTIEGLAIHLGIHRETVREWAKIHAEFSAIFNVLQEIQAKELINKGLSGDYNPIIAKMLLSKHGYVEKSEQDQTIKQEVTFKDAE